MLGARTMRLLPFLFFAAFVVPAAPSDSEFNGRWDITISKEPKSRAWWLEVNGAGTPGMKGKFVGFPGGQMDEIKDLSIENGELKFSFDGTIHTGEHVHQEYRARARNGKLYGTMQSGSSTLQWVGIRAPEINEKDDGSWREGTPIQLFNGKDLSGWKGVIPGKPLGWNVKDGVLSNAPDANNIETERKFWNFILHAEYRLDEHSNSGIGLRGRYEVQILADYGRPVDGHSNASLYSRIVPSQNASKPAGEWQTCDIRLVGRDVTVVLNGTKVIDKGVIEGLTAIATDPDEAKPGPIVVQGDHERVELRSLVLTPLTR
jgi:hypothetical protein